MSANMKKLKIPIAALLLYMLATCCFVLPLIFTSLQFDGGAGYAITMYWAGGFISVLMGMLFHLWDRSRHAPGQKIFAAGVDKDVVPRRLGETEE
jgi:hypothetical protein